MINNIHYDIVYKVPCSIDALIWPICLNDVAMLRRMSTVQGGIGFPLVENFPFKFVKAPISKRSIGECFIVVPTHLTPSCHGSAFCPPPCD
jgi:hypothetical protein